MKEKLKRIVIPICALLMLLTIASCGIKNNSPVGKWYNESKRCLDVRSDGTWKLDHSYGTGKWKALDKDTFEFMDFYGDTQESNINTDELGKYIDFGIYGYFYKDEYPSAEKTSEVKAKKAVSIDPFKGIKYDVSGISPFCKIAINNQNCSNDAQKYVKYTIEGDYFANGDKAKIHAEIISTGSDDSYTLTKTDDTFVVSNAPFYIQSINDLDLTLITEQLNDYIISNTSFDSTYELFGIDAYSFLEKCGKSHNTYCNFYGVNSITEDQSYFLTLKKIKWNEFAGSKKIFNSIHVLTKCNAQASHESYPHDSKSEWYGVGNIYVCFYLDNIVKYPNGEIGFGITDPQKYDITGHSTVESLEMLKMKNVDSFRENYNVSLIENIDFLN